MMEMVGIVVRLLLFVSLIGTEYQFSRWACRKTSVFTIRLCYQEGRIRLLLWSGLLVWSLIGSIQLPSRGSMFFFLGGVYKVGVGAIPDSHGGGSDSIPSFMSCSLHSGQGLQLLLGDFLLVVSNRRESMVFLGLSLMNHSFRSCEFFLIIKGRWCDIIIFLYLWSESVWLPKRHVPTGEERILHSKDLLLLWRNISELLLGPLDGGVNNKVVSPWSILR